MRQDEIVSRLKAYQVASKDASTREKLRAEFLAGINRRIAERHGRCANCAIARVLDAMHGTPTRPILCLEAMLQLCRDDDGAFSPWQDADLVARINASEYFTSTAPKDLYVETQDGVV